VVGHPEVELPQAPERPTDEMPVTRPLEAQSGNESIGYGLMLIAPV
jgi:hypothetical protein